MKEKHSPEGVYSPIYSFSFQEKYVLPYVASSTEGKYMSNVPGSLAEEYAFIGASSSEEECMSNVAGSLVGEYVLNIAGSLEREYVSNIASSLEREYV
ncbi:hypothetical protein F8M41_004593 [Gigaspora margarita]|uniref:Uncharacterized protein n=1 Tax=Gigaspora margarita TaxID=4874 RepID=A0A8H4ERQ8_GIGMA|nr:hypothetical protein F8M41_004593 [Gigaspora margarita]